VWKILLKQDRQFSMAWKIRIFGVGVDKNGFAREGRGGTLNMPAGSSRKECA
jgi:hypothetical protein